MPDFTCKQINDLLFDYIDGEMKEADRQKFEEHIDKCEDCKEKLKLNIRFLNDIKDSRYEYENSLYAAMVPQLEIESKKMKLSNMRRNLRVIGSIAISACFIFAILVYFGPFSSLTDNSIMKNSVSQNDITGETTEFAYGDAADTEDSLQFSPYDYSENADENIEEEIVEEDMMPQTASEKLPFGLNIRSTPETEEESRYEAMVMYLNSYAPEYVEQTDTLYILRENIVLPEGVDTIEIVDEPEYEVYILDKISNAGFALNMTDESEVYHADVSDDAVRPYIIIIAINSQE